MTHAEVAVGILSDTHGQVHPSVMDTMNRCDIVLHAGDICASSVLECLQPRGGKLLAVRGNNDVPRNWPVGGSYRLEDLPEEAMLELPGGRVALLHGHQFWGRADFGPFLLQHYRDARAIVYGHSHYLHHEQYDGRWLLNPGAAGKRLNRGAASCLVLRASHVAWSVCVSRFTWP